MVSRFDTNFAASALPQLWDTFATTGRFTYTPVGGSATAYEAIIGEERIDQADDNSGQALSYVRKVKVRTSALSDPKLNATASVDGTAYAIRHRRGFPGAWELELYRATPSELTRPRYRGTA